MSYRLRTGWSRKTGSGARSHPGPKPPRPPGWLRAPEVHSGIQLDAFLVDVQTDQQRAAGTSGKDYNLQPLSALCDNTRKARTLKLGWTFLQ